MINRGLFSSASQHWSTPKELYAELDKEFHFNDDPCPIGGVGGLGRSWGTSTFCNPPYGKEIMMWLRYAHLESSLGGKTVVCLVPSRTDTHWWHEYCMKADEIRFLRGRLKFGDSKNSAPFPSAIIIFKPKPQ